MDGTNPCAYDPRAVEHTLKLAGAFFGPRRYFGLEVDGWENIPSAPVMLVGNHSGGTSIPDVWGLGVAWYRHFGSSRPVHAMGHDAVFATDRLAEFFTRRGILRARRDLALAVLTEHRRDLLVYPGGDLETWRTYSRRYEVDFGGRRGYARTAMKAGVPVVPVAHVGAHETLMVLARGRRLARFVGLRRVVRAEIFPVHLSVPWGLTVGPWPHIPLPTRFSYRIGEPIDPTSFRRPEVLDRVVRNSLQTLLDQLRGERRSRWRELCYLASG